jgi:hypothetical protein
MVEKSKQQFREGDVVRHSCPGFAPGEWRVVVADNDSGTVYARHVSSTVGGASFSTVGGAGFTSNALTLLRRPMRKGDRMRPKFGCVPDGFVAPPLHAVVTHVEGAVAHEYAIAHGYDLRNVRALAEHWVHEDGTPIDVPEGARGDVLADDAAKHALAEHWRRSGPARVLHEERIVGRNAPRSADVVAAVRPTCGVCARDMVRDRDGGYDCASCHPFPNAPALVENEPATPTLATLRDQLVPLRDEVERLKRALADRESELYRKDREIERLKRARVKGAG